jgi:hypothetical protein
MKYLVLLFALFGAIAPSHAKPTLSIQAMEDGCKRGSQDGARIAVLVEKAMSAILKATEPESTVRKLEVKKILDISRKKEDDYNDKTEKEQDRWIASSQTDISDYYERQIFKSNVEIRFMAMQSAYKLGIDLGITNGINDISSSESRYRREIENECKIIYSSK